MAKEVNLGHLYKHCNDLGPDTGPSSGFNYNPADPQVDHRPVGVTGTGGLPTVVGSGCLYFSTPSLLLLLMLTRGLRAPWTMSVQKLTSKLHGHYGRAPYRWNQGPRLPRFPVISFGSALVLLTWLISSHRSET